MKMFDPPVIDKNIYFSTKSDTNQTANITTDFSTKNQTLNNTLISNKSLAENLRFLEKNQDTKKKKFEDKS